MPYPLPRLIVAASVAAALGACAQQPPAAPGPCTEAAASFAVGKVADAKLAEEARVRANATRVRMVHPNQAVTMEFDASRLTLAIDAQGKVARAACG